MKRLYVPFISLIIILLINCGFMYIKNEYDENPTLNILMFHVVCKEMPEDKSLSGLYITDERLREYCEYFTEKGYNIVSLKEAYNIYKKNIKLSNPNLLVFTFDDGYADNYTLGFPVLNELGIKFNLNVIAKYTDEKYFNYLTWDQINEMSKSGLLEIGNHSYNSHIYVDDYKGDSVPLLKALLPNENMEEREIRIFNDLEKADSLISQKTESITNIMAYPYGVAPNDLKDYIAKKFDYYIELLVRPGVNRDISDFKGLHRFTVNGNEKPEILERKMLLYKGISFLNNMDI